MVNISVGSKKLSPFIAFNYSGFRNFWIGSFFGSMAQQMQVVATAYQIYFLTKSATSLGMIGLFGFLSILVFSMIGGITADKVHRKAILLTCQLAAIVLSLSLVFSTHNQFITPTIIYLSVSLFSMISAFNGPARQSVLPHLVPEEHFVNAVSTNTLQNQGAVVIGPAIAGIVIAASGVLGVYLLMALFYTLSFISLFLVRIPEHKNSNLVSFSFQSVWKGISFVKSSPIISSTMILDFLANFLGSATVLMPIFAADILKIGPQGLGILYSAPSVGGILAGLIFATFTRVSHQGKIIIGAVLVYGLATIGFGFSRSLPLSLLFLAIAGAADMVSTILRNTIRQILTPDYIRGRMVSVNMVFVQGGPKLGEFEAGFVAAAFGAPVSVVLGGVGVLAITILVAGMVPSLVKYQGKVKL